MLTVKGTDIHITKGDTGYLYLNITDENNNKYIIKDGDTVTITVKSTQGTKIFSHTVPANEAFIIEPNDTADAGIGRYKYDIQLNTANNEVFTIIPVSSFFIEEGVTE